MHYQPTNQPTNTAYLRDARTHLKRSTTPTGMKRGRIEGGERGRVGEEEEDLAMNEKIKNLIGTPL